MSDYGGWKIEQGIRDRIAHEAWLIEREREDDRWAGFPDAPTRAEVREVAGGCGCLVSMVYGGDCEHTVELEGDER